MLLSVLLFCYYFDYLPVKLKLRGLNLYSSNMVGWRNCAVMGCSDTTSHRHRFPNHLKQLERFHRWIASCGNPVLVVLDPNLVYRSYRVCHIHFPESDRTSNMYISKTCVPSLSLPVAASETSSNEEGTSEEQPENVPSTSQEISSVTLAHQHECFQEQGPVMQQEVATKGCALQKNLVLENNQPEHVLSISKRISPILRKINVCRASQLTHNEAILYSRVKQLSRMTSTYKKHTLSLKTRLKVAEREFRRNPFKYFDIKESVLNFCRTQLMMSKYKPKGRRYSTQDKIMALALYKQSGRCYRFLSKMFCLPSRKTIINLLRQVPVQAGISRSIFNNMKKLSQKMRNQDRLCILMFDEIQLCPHFDYKPNTDEIIGFEDLGDKQTLEIADKALVFMLQGIVKKWKQPIAYFFSAGSTKTVDLVRLLKMVVSEVQETGFKVMATICDQAPTNQAAINYLINEMRRLKLRCEEEQAYENVFSVNGQIMVPMYDPPHLIKGIRNHFLQKDIVWQNGDRKLIGKWEDIRKAYLIDSTSGQKPPKSSNFLMTYLIL